MTGSIIEEPEANLLDTGAALWDYMRDELHKCDNVMPLVWWDGGGHAINMVGYDETNIINDPWTSRPTLEW